MTNFTNITLQLSCRNVTKNNFFNFRNVTWLCFDHNHMITDTISILQKQWRTITLNFPIMREAFNSVSLSLTLLSLRKDNACRINAPWIRSNRHRPSHGKKFKTSVPCNSGLGHRLCITLLKEEMKCAPFLYDYLRIVSIKWYYSNFLL